MSTDSDIKEYSKIMIYTYGKVGSTSIRVNNISGRYYGGITDEYPEFILQIERHNVAKDIITKYQNVLVINIVRLPIDRNISAFWQFTKFKHPFYLDTSIEELNYYFLNTKINIINNDSWMNKCFENLNVNIDNLTFDSVNKYNLVNLENNNDLLMFRFEDWSYMKYNVLPKFKVLVAKNANVTSNKKCADKYKEHKEFYKVTETEKENIKNSKILKFYYTEDEINAHISKYE